MCNLQVVDSLLGAVKRSPSSQRLEEGNDPGNASAQTAASEQEIEGAAAIVQNKTDAVTIEDEAKCTEVEIEEAECAELEVKETECTEDEKGEAERAEVEIEEVELECAEVEIEEVQGAYMDIEDVDGAEVDKEKEKKPLVDSIIEEVTSPGTKRKLVEQEHTYCKKTKINLNTIEPSASLTSTISENIQYSYNSDDSDDDEDDAYDFDENESSVGYDACSSDEDWVPGKEELDSDDENNERQVQHSWLRESDDLSEESKSIVFDSQLKKLFQRCQQCGARVKCASLKQRGSLICVTYSCVGGHTDDWFSQPLLKGAAEGNLVCSAGILYTGNHYASTNAFMSASKIRFFTKGNFNSHQRKYLWPVVNQRFQLQNTELLQSLQGERLVLAGDGRCDSPGHNAKYGIYSIMHVPTEKIIDFSLVQVSEVANSNCMEKEGLKRCLENLERSGQVVDILATDR